LLVLVVFVHILVPALTELLGVPVPTGGEPLFVQDDACDAAGSCGLELRQLRAQVGNSREGQAVEEQNRDIGLHAVGRNMWAETTWGDVLLEINSTASSMCDTDTGGSCEEFGCDESRGAVQCVGGRCVCRPGYCARGGFCFPQSGQCVVDTGGSCNFGHCWYSRGHTKCKSGECLCQEGGCAWKGKCFPVTDTGASCELYACAESRGPATCHRGRCLCQQGYIAVGGKCEARA